MGSQTSQPPGSLRCITSEKTPCVCSPILIVRPGRSISAWVNVSPALTVEPPISTATGPVYRGASAGYTYSGCGRVKRLGSAGSFRARLAYAK